MKTHWIRNIVVHLFIAQGITFNSPHSHQSIINFFILNDDFPNAVSKCPQ